MFHFIKDRLEIYEIKTLENLYISKIHGNIETWFLSAQIYNTVHLSLGEAIGILLSFFAISKIFDWRFVNLHRNAIYFVLWCQRITNFSRVGLIVIEHRRTKRLPNAIFKYSAEWQTQSNQSDLFVCPCSTRTNGKKYLSDRFAPNVILAFCFVIFKYLLNIFGFHVRISIVYYSMLL